MATMVSFPRKHANQVSSASPFFSSSSSLCPPAEAPCRDSHFVVRGSSKSQMCLRRIIATILHHSKKVPEVSVSRSLNSAIEQTKGKESAQFEDLKPSETRKERAPVSESGEGRRLIDLNLRLALPEAGDAPQNGELNGDSACSGVGGVVKCGGNDYGWSVESVNGFASRRSESEGECDPKGVRNSEEDATNGEKREVSNVIDGCVEAALSEDDSRQCCDDHTDVITFANNLTEEKGNSDGGGDDVVAKYDSVPLASCSEEKKSSQHFPKSGTGKIGVSDDGYLGLLIEAVRLVSGNLFPSESDEDPADPAGEVKASGDDKNAAPSCRSRRGISSSKRCWMLEFYDGFEDSAPVVKSKRGRNQTLPSRYRDSVLDPWKRFPQRKLPNRSAKRSF